MSLAPPCPAAVAQLMQRAAGVSLLGDYSAPLAILQHMAACKPLAVALTQLPAWLPQWQVGRGLGLHVGAAAKARCQDGTSRDLQLLVKHHAPIASGS